MVTKRTGRPRGRPRKPPKTKRRGDALEKRRDLMQAWADYIDPAGRA